MTRKKIHFKPKSELKTVEQVIDDWIAKPSVENVVLSSHSTSKTDDNTDVQQEDFFRFTFHMPTMLHKKIKKHCVDNDISMKEKIVEILAREFSS